MKKKNLKRLLGIAEQNLRSAIRYLQDAKEKIEVVHTEIPDDEFLKITDAITDITKKLEKLADDVRFEMDIL